MTGEGQNVTVMCGTCYTTYGLKFKNTDVRFENLKMIQCRIEVTGTSQQPEPAGTKMLSVKLLNIIIMLEETVVYIEHTESHASHVNVCDRTKITLEDCTFRHSEIRTFNTTKVILKDCHLYSSPFFTYNSTTIITGDSDFAASDQPAISSYSSNITLSENVSFANNTGSRGGAMHLYSSTLYMAAGANVSFFNNSATDKGGAIYVEPGLSSLNYVWSPCFYQLLDCSNNTNYTFYFSNNSAANGGDDIYGALLLDDDICTMPWSGKCNLRVTVASPSNSSNSSDPLRVCTCDNDGKPQCTSNSYLNNHLQVYPGEIFTVSAVVVGGDLGLTTGVVYAGFSLENSVSRMQPTSQYSQLINSIASCAQLNYTLYPEDGVQNITMYLTTCLLYTSPSPRDATLSRMPSSA